MRKATAELILKDPDRFAHHDRVFLNNPVVMQGMGLAPLVVLATTAHNGVMLAAAVTLLLVPSRVLACLLSRLFPLNSENPAPEELQKKLLPRALVYSLSASVVYSALGGANAVSLSAAWRYRGGSYGAETALTPDTAKLLGGALDPDKTLELRITATDGFGQSALRTESLAGRRWAMKLRPDGLGVGFGMSPQEGSALELPDGWRVLIGGRSAAEQAWPVGAVFWTPEATNPASLLGFGTWSRVNSALPAAWKRDE